MAAARWLLPPFFAALSACSSPRLATPRGPDPLLITEDEVLASLATTDVGTVRLYRFSEAVTKYGTGNAGGVIAITTRK